MNLRLKKTSKTSLVTFTTGLFVFAVSSLSMVIGISSAEAELWRCTSKDSSNPIFTETPSFGDDVNCEAIGGGRFSKPGQGGADPRAKVKTGDKKGRNSSPSHMARDAKKKLKGHSKGK